MPVQGSCHEEEDLALVPEPSAPPHPLEQTSSADSANSPSAPSLSEALFDDDSVPDDIQRDGHLPLGEADSSLQANDHGFPDYFPEDFEIARRNVLSRKLMKFVLPTVLVVMLLACLALLMTAMTTGYWIEADSEERVSGQHIHVTAHYGLFHGSAKQTVRSYSSHTSSVTVHTEHYSISSTYPTSLKAASVICLIMMSLSSASLILCIPLVIISAYAAKRSIWPNARRRMLLAAPALILCVMLCACLCLILYPSLVAPHYNDIYPSHGLALSWSFYLVVPVVALGLLAVVLVVLAHHHYAPVAEYQIPTDDYRAPLVQRVDYMASSESA